LLLFVVTFTASIVIFFVNARFRLPIVPVVIVFAGYTLHVWLEGACARQPLPGNIRGHSRPAGRWISVLIAALGLAFVWPNPVLRAAELSASHFLEGQRYEELRDYAKAIAAYERCKLHADARGDSYVLRSRTTLARIYAEVCKDLPRARQNFLEALSLAPNDMAILNDIGVMYNLFGQYEEAKPYLLKALKVSPGNQNALRNLAKSYEMTQDYDNAIVAYRQMVVRAGPNAYVAYTQMGNVYWRKGDATSARDAVTRALALKPDYAPAQKLLAELPP
jgi:tetratricopeptide (TPR) repeat protein